MRRKLIYGMPNINLDKAVESAQILADEMNAEIIQFQVVCMFNSVYCCVMLVEDSRYAEDFLMVDEEEIDWVKAMQWDVTKNG